MQWYWVYFLAFMWSQSFTGIGLWAIVRQCFYGSVSYFGTILTYLNYMFFFLFPRRCGTILNNSSSRGSFFCSFQVCFSTVTFTISMIILCHLYSYLLNVVVVLVVYRNKSQCWIMSLKQKDWYFMVAHCTLFWSQWLDQVGYLFSWW